MLNYKFSFSLKLLPLFFQNIWTSSSFWIPKAYERMHQDGNRPLKHSFRASKSTKIEMEYSFTEHEILESTMLSLRIICGVKYCTLEMVKIISLKIQLSLGTAGRQESLSRWNLQQTSSKSKTLLSLDFQKDVKIIPERYAGQFPGPNHVYFYGSWYLNLPRPIKFKQFWKILTDSQVCFLWDDKVCQQKKIREGDSPTALSCTAHNLFFVSIC